MKLLVKKHTTNIRKLLNDDDDANYSFPEENIPARMLADYRQPFNSLYGECIPGGEFSLDTAIWETTTESDQPKIKILSSKKCQVSCAIK